MSRTIAAPAVIDWTCSTDDATPEQKAVALSSAQTWLWALSGRRYGTFATVDDLYRTISAKACEMPSQGRWTCCRIPLHLQPVQAITAVRLDGVVLDPAGYALEAGALLRVGACWPTAPDCGPARIGVDYEWGIPFVGFAAAALGEVACEFLAGMTGQSCRLPSRAISISRQGVQIEMDDASTFAENGLTGLPIADAWLRTVNPNQLKQRSRVHSPDLPRSV